MPDSIAPSLGGAVAMATGIVMGNLVLFLIWLGLVFLDFASAGLRVFMDEDEDWKGTIALKGAAKKGAYLGSAMVAAGFDLAAGELIAPEIASMGLLTKAMFAMLIVIEGLSAARNFLVVNGEWRLYQILVRAGDVLRDPGKARHGNRWYDNAEPPDIPADEPTGEATEEVP